MKKTLVAVLTLIMIINAVSCAGKPTNGNLTTTAKDTNKHEEHTTARDTQNIETTQASEITQNIPDTSSESEQLETTATTPITTLPVQQETSPISETTAEAKKPDDTTSLPETSDREKLYRELIEDYKKLISFRLSYQFTNDKWDENIKTVDFSNTYLHTTKSLGDLQYRWNNMIIELPNSPEAMDPNSYGYIMYDINNDGIPELFWMRSDHSIAAIFTYKNASVILLDAFWSRYQCYVAQDKSIYCYGSNGAADNTCYTFSLDSNGKWTEIYGFYSQSNWQTESVNFFEYSNNKTIEISRDRYFELVDAYPHKQSDYWMSVPIIPLQ